MGLDDVVVEFGLVSAFRFCSPSGGLGAAMSPQTYD